MISIVLKLVHIIDISLIGRISRTESFESGCETYFKIENAAWLKICLATYVDG